MKKRVFALALALMLCMALLPAALAAEDDGSQSSSLQGEGTEEDPWILTQTGIEKTKVTTELGSTYYSLQTGTYRLDEDITVDKYIQIKDAEVTIGLNGHTLENNADSGTLLYLTRSLIDATVRLTLVDNSTEKTGEVRSGSGFVVNLNSNTAFDGTYVPIYGEVENGGTISGGTFYGAVENPGTINGGTFYGAVTNNGGRITGGTFYGTVTTIGNAAISGKTVTFKTGENTSYAQMIVASGEKATRPSDPTRDGFCFGGWYTDANGTTEYNFESTVTDNITLYAKWQSHTYEWKTENGQYWQKCKDCGHETEKKAVPTIAITGADKVCQTQGYTFTVTAPEGATAVKYGYDFENRGDSALDMTPNNGNYSATLASSMLENESSFILSAEVTGADGYTVSTSKTVQILSEHTGGTATCAAKAECEVCGQPYGDLAAHDLQHVEAKAATVEAEGNIEYWHCEDCGKYFSDEGSKTEIALADAVIAKLTPTPTPAPTAAPTAAPSATATPTAKPATAPHTADEANAILWLALAMMSVMGIAVVGRKKVK